MRQVLILTTDAGHGHSSCVETLKEILSEIPDLNLVCLDIFRDILPEYDVFKKFTGLSGADIYNRFVLQRSWSTLFWPLFALAALVTINTRANAASKKLGQVLIAYDPDLIISVTPLVNAVIADAIRHHYRSVRFLTVMLDLIEVLPRTWLQDCTQTILVPTEITHARLVRRWSTNRVVCMQGLPISQKFSIARQRHSKSSARRLLGVKIDRPVVLVSFGGRGSDRIVDYAKVIDETSLGIQSIYVCGKNEDSIGKLRHLKNAAILDGRCLVVGFSEELPLLSVASDIFIGKPGPFSIFECVETQLPMLLEFNHKTLIHERFNAKFVRSSGLGTTFRSPTELTTVLHKFLAEKMQFSRAAPLGILVRQKLRVMIEENL